MKRPACFVSDRVSGPCSACGRHVDRVHLPNVRGIFCDICCPVCSPAPPQEITSAPRFVRYPSGPAWICFIINGIWGFGFNRTAAA